jgi:hypothetical protein
LKTERQSDVPLVVQGTVAPLLRDIGLPFATWWVAQRAGASTLVALSLGAVWPIVFVAVGLLRRRRVDRIALMVLVFIAVGTATALISGSARFAVAKDSAFTGVAGLVFVSARFMQTSLLAGGYRAFVTGGNPHARWWDDLWRRSPNFREFFYRLDLIYGVALICEALVRVVAVYTLPLRIAIVLSPIIAILTFMLLAAVCASSGKALGRLLRSEGIVGENATST